MQQREWHFHYPTNRNLSRLIMLVWIVPVLLGFAYPKLYWWGVGTGLAGAIGLGIGIDTWWRSRRTNEFVRLDEQGLSFQINPDPATYRIPYSALLYVELDYQLMPYTYQMTHAKLHLEYRLPEDDPDSEPRKQLMDLRRLHYPPPSWEEWKRNGSGYAYAQTVLALHDALIRACAPKQLALFSPTQAMRDKAWLEQEKQRTREWLDSFKKPY
ncbi:hypothetical protein [Conchiformibius kuhniae]|uniref:Uncharacterized protein n=1 Tax=Conchiformibius kuhniae TaxID=211502 RepID=A0A8T9MT64_9NEIS|nr:hypothetical protein [Conchiformibius kuhniae]UOP04459.1 hypothetical protein LVJ77_09200 [Conchiformibius kuhniae]